LQLAIFWPQSDNPGTAQTIR